MPDIDLSVPEKKISAAALALRLRHARLVFGLTLRQLSQKAACSESLISKYENNMATPSQAVLHRLAVALDINLSDLMLETEEASGGVVARFGSRPFVQNNGIALERLNPLQRSGLLHANIHIMEEGACSSKPVDSVGEEMGYVLQGKLELDMGGKLYVLESGDSFSLVNSLCRSYRNVGPGVLKVLWVCTPASYF